SLALGEPFSVELSADAGRRQFLVRASTAPMRQQLLSQLGAAYPQAEFRELARDDDPAIARNSEQVLACTLGLRAPDYLPLRSVTDLDVDGQRAAQADPVFGILSALGDLPAGWRGLSQIVLLPAPENWCRDYERLAVQHPLEHERVPRPAETAGPMLVFVAMLVVISVVGLQGYAFLRAGQTVELGGLAAAAFFGVVAGVTLVRRLTRTTVYDMDLVREKVSRIACRGEVRLIV